MGVYGFQINASDATQLCRRVHRAAPEIGDASVNSTVAGFRKLDPGRKVDFAWQAAIHPVEGDAVARHGTFVSCS